MGKKRKMSEATKIRLLAVKLIKSEKPFAELSALRLIQGPETYTNLIQKLESFPNSITNLPSSDSKRSLKQLNSPHLSSISIDKEFSWVKSIIANNTESINQFVKDSNSYSYYLLQGEFNLAFECLEKIEEKYGQSLWLIKNKIALHQEIGGLDAHKKYVGDIKDKLNDNKLLNFIIHWVSVRNEDNTSINRFNQRISKIIESFNPEKQEGYYEYCQHHILDEGISDPEKFIHILRMDYSRSFIDLYESFITFLNILFINEDSKINLELALEKLYKEVEDPRLIFLRDLQLGSTVKTKYQSNHIFEKADSYFINGEYEKSFESAYKQTQKVDSYVGFLLLAAKAKSMILDEKVKLDLKKPKDIIIAKLSSIYKFGVVKAYEEVAFLRKFQKNFASIKCTKGIDFILGIEKQSFYQPDKLDFLKVINSGEFSPLFLSSLAPSIGAEKYLKNCNDIFSLSPTMQIEFSLYNKSKLPENIDIHKDMFNKIIGEKYFSEQNFEESIKFGILLKNSEFQFLKRKGISLITYSYLGLKDYQNTCLCIADYYLENNDIYSYLPITELLQIATPGSQEWDVLKSMIEFPIIWNIYTEHIEATGEVSRSYAYEDFLTENGISRPSELKKIEETLNKKKLVYYLKNICVEQNMDTSDVFENGSKEVVDERLKICRILVDIDKKNELSYQKEIAEIIKRQVISNNTKEFDNSRIQVDIDSIVSWANKELEESYNRYLAYLNHGILIEEKSGTKRKQITNTTQNISVPNDEVHALLKGMVEDIVGAYLSAEYGLDRFLSTRVRHGILDRHLRRPLANEKLITKKESERGKYLNNDFLNSQIIDSGDIYLKAVINNISASFSKSYDSFVSEIANEWIQIKGKNKLRGLFDFQIHDEDIVNISKEISGETTLDEFIKFVIDLLDTLLVHNLARIREELNTKGKSQAKALLNKFQKDLSKFSTDLNINEIDDAISRSRTALQIQFDKITEWFVPSSSGNSPPFSIVDAIDVAKAVLQEGDTIFETEIDVVGELFAIHGSLPKFVDIFVNLLDNIDKRSGLDNIEGRIRIETREIVNDIQVIDITVSNGLGSSIDIKKVEEKLKRKKLLLQSGNYNDYLAKEGNSGLFKVHKIVSELKVKDADIKSSMDFDINENEYWVTISIPFKVFTLEIEQEA